MADQLNQFNLALADLEARNVSLSDSQIKLKGKASAANARATALSAGLVSLCNDEKTAQQITVINTLQQICTLQRRVQAAESMAAHSMVGEARAKLVSLHLQELNNTHTANAEAALTYAASRERRSAKKRADFSHNAEHLKLQVEEGHAEFHIAEMPGRANGIDSNKNEKMKRLSIEDLILEVESSKNTAAIRSADDDSVKLQSRLDELANRLRSTNESVGPLNHDVTMDVSSSTLLPRGPESSKSGDRNLSAKIEIPSSSSSPRVGETSSSSVRQNKEKDFVELLQSDERMQDLIVDLTKKLRSEAEENKKLKKDLHIARNRISALETAQEMNCIGKELAEAKTREVSAQNSELKAQIASVTQRLKVHHHSSRAAQHEAHRTAAENSTLFSFASAAALENRKLRAKITVLSADILAARGARNAALN